MTDGGDELDDDPLFSADFAFDDEPPPNPASTVVDLFVALIDAATGRVPIRPRVKVSAAGMLRGEVDVVKVEVPGFLVSGLVVDRFSVRGERVRIAPGLPPRLQAQQVTLKAVVGQDNVDRWTHAARLPFRMRLTPEGVVVSTGLAGIRVGEVEVDLAVAGPFLRLHPRRATIVGLPAPLVRVFRGYLPLPPLPRGARLQRVEPGDGELAVTFAIDDVDEPMTPQIAQRLARFLRVPLANLPGLGSLPGRGD